MAYSPDLRAASRRHCEAANTLFDVRRKDVAGYLYGIAAECAVKTMMIEAGLRPLSNEQKRDDPFFAHFPQLRTMLRDCLRGRASTELRRLIENDQLMSQWDIQMRYCLGNQIDDSWVEKWRDQTHQILASMGT